MRIPYECEAGADCVGRYARGGRRSTAQHRPTAASARSGLAQRALQKLAVRIARQRLVAQREGLRHLVVGEPLAAEALQLLFRDRPLEGHERVYALAEDRARLADDRAFEDRGMVAEH